MTAPPRIRRRVAAWFAASTFLVLALGAIVLRQLFAEGLDREFRLAQDGIGALVHSFFRAEVPEYKSVENTLAHVAAEHDFAQSRIHFVRPDGSVFEPLPELAARHAPLAPPIREATYPLDAELAPRWMVRVETSAATLVASRQTLDRWLAGTLVGAVVAALLVGWFVTGRALAPVRAMADAAAAMGPSAAGARLPVADPADELGQLGGRFNALLDRLDDALGQQRRFLAVAAHELRTPIARLRSEVEVATLDATAPAPALARMTAELEGLTTLVDTLLQLARAEAMPNAVRPAAGSLDDLVAEALERWRNAARLRGVSLEAAALDDAPAWIDAGYATRLLDVVLDNALRYTPRNGHVRVHCARVGERSVVTVDDTGPGIPPEERAQVFERFWRGAEARRSAPEGSGLGLALAKWIADAHGAAMTVGESPGGGARVQIAFATSPLAP